MRTGKLTQLELLLNSPTYKTLYEYLSKTCSIGRIEGGTITDNEDGSITVAAGKGIIRTSDNVTGAIKIFDWVENDNVELINNSLNYITVNYNTETEAVTISLETNVNSINFTTTFVIGYCYRVGAITNIIHAGNYLPNSQIRNCLQKFSSGIEWNSGLGLAAKTVETSSRYLTISTGLLFLGDTFINIDAIDSSLVNFKNYYYLLNGAWTILAGTGQINKLNYNDISTPGSESLAELTTNRYGVHWIYISLDGYINIILGRGDYTLAQAQAALPPILIPDFLQKFSILAGKVIIQKNQESFYNLETAFIKKFTSTIAENHNDLGNLQGGVFGKYYHLTGVLRDTFDNDDLAAGILTITHNFALDTNYSVKVTILNNEDKEIIPDEITCATNTVTIDLSSYESITGTWKYLVLG